MRQYTPFSPVEISFATRNEAMDYLYGLVPGEEQTIVLASKRRIKELNLEQWLSDIKNTYDVIHLSLIPANPAISDVYNSLIQLRGTNPHKIIAIGGGSCIDLAKAISAFFNLIPEDLLSEQSVRNAIKNKEYLHSKRFIDIIAIPTTAGTGSEVTKWATIWDMEQKEKLSIDCNGIYPKAAMIVPEFTTSMPARLTLSSGLDALSHAMEAFWARSRTPLSQALAITAIENIKTYLPKVLSDGSNIEYRKGMCLASLIAGLAFSITRTAASHSISYPLTIYYGMDHGFAAACTLPQVAERNESTVQGISRIYTVFGGKSEFSRWLKNVSDPVQELRLSAFGIKRSDLDFIAEKAFTKGRMDNNPIALSQEDVRSILENIL